MKISTRGEYAIRAMLYLAWKGPDRANQCQSKEISQAQSIPEHYLKHLLAELKAAGLIRSSRGPHGGHWLARPPAEVTIADILLAMEGQLTHIEDILHMPCDIEVGPDHCAIKSLWIEVKDAVEAILCGTTLEDLHQRQRRMVAGTLRSAQARAAQARAAATQDR